MKLFTSHSILGGCRRNATIGLLSLLFSAVGLAAQGQDPVLSPRALHPPSGTFEPKPHPAIVACPDIVTPANDGLVIWSPNQKQYLVNKQDSNGIFQIYIGTPSSAPVCVTCTQVPNGPAPNLHKLQPRWYPSGQWIVLAVEEPDAQLPPAPAQFILGWLQSGIWMNIFMMRPDGSQWVQLSDFGSNNKYNGFTGVAFTNDGKTAVWAQIVNGSVTLKALFGEWRLMRADYEENGGVPSFANVKDITPAGAIWVEPGNFAPDGKSLLITADIGMTDPQGMDQYILNIDTGEVRDLTNSPSVWDEHGLFSPDGSKIVFMSSYPYRDLKGSDSFLGLHTEFMIMNSDGTGLVQVTHFNVPGYTESNPPSQKTTAAVAGWNPGGKTLIALNLTFPNYTAWTISFGRCIAGLAPENRTLAVAFQPRR